MAKTYRITGGQRPVNAWFGFLTKRGLGAPYRRVLTVTGRTTGRSRSTPVDVMTVSGQRFLVAPYGDVNWVGNGRAAGQISLRRGQRTPRHHAEEVTPTQAVPVIRAYIDQVPVTRRYWEVTSQSTNAEVAASAARHPVFHLNPAD